MEAEKGVKAMQHYGKNFAIVMNPKKEDFDNKEILILCTNEKSDFFAWLHNLKK